MNLRDGSLQGDEGPDTNNILVNGLRTILETRIKVIDLNLRKKDGIDLSIFGINNTGLGEEKSGRQRAGEQMITKDIITSKTNQLRFSNEKL